MYKILVVQVSISRGDHKGKMFRIDTRISRLRPHVRCADLEAPSTSSQFLLVQLAVRCRETLQLPQALLINRSCLMDSVQGLSGIGIAQEGRQDLQITRRAPKVKLTTNRENQSRTLLNQHHHLSETLDGGVLVATIGCRSE